MTHRIRFHQAVLLSAMIFMAFSRSSAAVDCSVADSRFATSFGNTFNITSTGFAATEIQTSANYWSCAGYSNEIPTFQLGGTGGIPVTITKVEGNSTSPEGGCGRTTYPGTTVGRTVSSVEITIWTTESDGDSCAPLTDTLAHELGHVLLLADVPDSSCIGHIMGRRYAGGTRTVYADDCAVADAQWTTSQEGETNDPYCEAYGCSPILVDLENDGFQLTGLDDPVWFDIDADGDMDLMSWTNRGEGMLALDRNGNGAIDDGGELFGDATLLADGTRAANGYLALAELDSWLFGGNGDGVIDATDAAFGTLLLWTDTDHSGTSKPGELQTFEQAGILRIGLQYRTSHRVDRYGNEFRYLGHAWQERRGGGVRPILTWDVFFRVKPL
ncbi:MAG TPA: hypothetical protein VEW48_09670 [Thermoanaerobaculia bacterium]|nr:hypothetical protein [Thermoanaerobaculia bacterium]